MAVDVTSTPLLLFALAREAAPLRGRWPFAVVGMGPVAAAQSARQLLASQRPAAVVSIGIAGGLRSGLVVGDVVVPAEVVSTAGRWVCAPFLGAMSGRLLSTDSVISTPADKRRLAVEFVADVVDMEAAAIAEICFAAGVPFAAVKAVSDPLDVCLPAELATIAPDGRPRIGKLLAALVRRPRLLGELIRLERDSRRAARAACERVAASR